MRTRLETEDGVVTGMVAVIALALLTCAALAFDGGALIEAHSSARSTATAAARAGAQELAIDALHRGTVRLDTSRAHTAATGLLDTAGVEGTIEVDHDQVTVTVHAAHRMLLLPVRDRDITAVATATAVSDVLGATP